VLLEPTKKTKRGGRRDGGRVRGINFQQKRGHLLLWHTQDNNNNNKWTSKYVWCVASVATVVGGNFFLKKNFFMSAKKFSSKMQLQGHTRTSHEKERNKTQSNTQLSPLHYSRTVTHHFLFLLLLLTLTLPLVVYTSEEERAAGGGVY